MVRAAHTASFIRMLTAPPLSPRLADGSNAWDALVPRHKASRTRKGGGNEGECETGRRGGTSIEKRTVLMEGLPEGWTGRAVTRQSSTQADIWMMAPDGSKMRSVAEVDAWFARQPGRTLSAAERRRFEDACRTVRRQAAQIKDQFGGQHRRSEGGRARSRSSRAWDDGEGPDDGTGGRRRRARAGAAARRRSSKTSAATEDEDESEEEESEEEESEGEESEEEEESELEEFMSVCWDCKKGALAHKHYTRSQCREHHGHRGLDWRDDPRQMGQVSGRGGKSAGASSGSSPLKHSPGKEAGRSPGNSGRNLGTGKKRQRHVAEENETCRMIAQRRGVSLAALVKLNKDEYPGLTPASRLYGGTVLRLPDGEGLGKAKGKVWRSKHGKNRQQTGEESESEESAGSGGEDQGKYRRMAFSTSHGHRRWGNRWGSGVIDPRAHGQASGKLMCSYMHCSMPHHSGRGDGEHGWKIVTGQTRAGNQVPCPATHARMCRLSVVASACGETLVLIRRSVRTGPNW